MSERGYEILSLDDLDRVPYHGGGQILRPPGRSGTRCLPPFPRRAWRTGRKRSASTSRRSRNSPTTPRFLYNLACMEAQGGRHLDALLHLQRAVALESKWAEYAAQDSDFAAIRAEPGFPAA